MFAVEHRTAEAHELRFEYVGETFAVRFVVVDDEDTLRTQLPCRFRVGEALAIVGRANAKKSVRLGVCYAELRGGLTLGQSRIRNRRTDLRQARIIRNRNLRLRDVGIKGSEHREDGVVGYERLRVLSALRRIVLAL